MDAIQGSFEHQGLLCFAKSLERYAYYYAPLNADLGRDARGRSMHSLLAIGPGGYLMLTAVWRAAEEAVESLRREIARREALAAPGEIELELAPVQMTGCNLLIGNGSGEFQVLASSATSRVPPYSALFSVNLNSEQYALAVAAFGGQGRCLAVEYDLSVVTPIAASGKLIPQSDQFAAWLRQQLLAGERPFREAIEQAIEDGTAAIHVSVPENPSSRLVVELFNLVVNRAAELLPSMLKTADAGALQSFEVSAELVDRQERPLHPILDLSELAVLGESQNQRDQLMRQRRCSTKASSS
jgi:hypothetical protein